MKSTLVYCAGRCPRSGMFLLLAVVVLVLWGTVSTDEAVAEETQLATESTGETPTPAPPPETDLAIVKTDSPDPVSIGSILSYTVNVNNVGAVDAADVVVMDTLPAGLSLISATPSQGACAGTTCNLGTIAAGAAAAVAYVATVEPGALASLVNTSCVETSTNDTNADNNCADEDTTITGASPTPAAPSVTPTPNGLPISGGFPGSDSPGGRLLLVLGIALTAIGAPVAFRFAGR